MKFYKNKSEENPITWEKVLYDPLEFDAAFKILPTKGNIAWEYNPFRNFRLDLDMYEYNGKLYTPSLYKKLELDSNNKNKLPDGVSLYLKGELVDFITDLLSFDVNNPVSIIPSYSYDGSVDLIINDGKNLPKLINSRFSTTGMNTYEIINRKGDNDTNIYDRGDLFDIDTSLYKKTNKIPKVVFNGTEPGGELKVGNYHFYFKCTDTDGNETDFVAESGLVSIFKGNNSPISINTGSSDENSLKAVSFTLKNIDSGYQYLHVYYTRSSAQVNLNFTTSAVKINLKFKVSTNGTSSILITGIEDSENIALSDINLSYNVVQAAKSLEICLNMLFLANVQKANMNYDELQDLSLRFLPYLHTKKYPLSMDENYTITSTSKGYYDSKFIYDFTGYWDKDLYRLGIVYILKDNTLSPVFNIRGRENVKSFKEYTHIKVGEISDEVNSGAYTKIDVFKKNSTERNYITYDETTNMIIKSNTEQLNTITGDGYFENVKGVVSLDSTLDTDTILGFDIRADEDTINELKKYVKGFFFVRQKRMPLTLCLGIAIGIEHNSKLPAIPTTHGVTNIDYTNTYVETNDMNPDEVHYVMEGFLGRYTYKLKPKSSGFWSKVFTALAITTLIAVGVVGSVFTGGAAGAVSGGIIAAMTAGAEAIGGILMATAIGAAVVVGTTVVVAAGQSIALSMQLARNSSETARPYKGRNATIPKGYKREEIDDSRKLDASFDKRIILLDYGDCSTQALLVPDYTVHLSKYNEIFNGDEFTVLYTNSLPITNFTNIGYFQNNNRHFYIPGYLDWNNSNKKNYVSLVGVPDSVAAVGLKSALFRSKAGDPGQVNKFEQTRRTYRDSTLNSHSDLIRGAYGPYVAMTGFSGAPTTTVSIKIPGYKETNLRNYISMRMSDHSEYSAISDRFDILECKNPDKALVLEDNPYYYFQTECFRGDCYICLVTHRLNRNLNDNSAPYNDTFVDTKTWKKYDVDNSDSLGKINVGDVNAVELGMWVTFKVRSNYNLNIRTLDESNLTEKAASGHSRGYFPKYPLSTDGSYKIPEALVYNLGFSKSLSERYNFEVPDVPYIKNWFGTRIMYSDINITDGFKNGFRTFKGTAYRDYTREYGSITKIVEMQGNLIVVFEHGIGFLEVNEKAVAALALSGNVYITTNNVLPEKLTILSDALGSQWADSILKVPVSIGSTSSVIFGVDTVAKKIWMCNGQNVQCISDFKVQEFLNNNITLGERDLTPVIGVRNVKTVYNAFKQDVMFTFYDCLNGFEDKAWNLCFNMTQFLLNNNGWTTFYSWVPAFMENIDNIPFSFDRDVIKSISKLGVSKMNNDFSDGIVLSNNIIPKDLTNYKIGKLHLVNRILPFTDNKKLDDKDQIIYKIKYEVTRDNFGNHNLFDVEEMDGEPWLVFKKIELLDVYQDANGDGKIDTSPSSKEKVVIKTGNGSTVKYYGVSHENRYTSGDINSELYYRNIKRNSYSDWEESSNMPEYHITDNETYIASYKIPKEGKLEDKSVSVIWPHKTSEESEDAYNTRVANTFEAIVLNNYPIFKDRSGKKIMLPEEDRINADQIVRYINIRANIYVRFKEDNKTLFDIYKSSSNEKETGEDGTVWINCGYYESTVAVTTEWNMQFLTSDFWKHGQAGLIDIADDIKPTVWYGKQHPFEFECVVVNDPSVHKIFLNLEIISNKAQPESFHFEIIGDSYDFAKDKPTMYFRQEARKAFFLYNGADITYNKDFLKILPKLSAKSAELIHSYYDRLDKLLDILDSYVGSAKNSTDYSNLNSYRYSNGYSNWALLSPNHDYRHLSGAEIVYYKNRNEYRIWQHLPAINIDDLPQDAASSIIRGNCLYLEDRWKVSINPLLICYKNEYSRKVPGVLCLPKNSTWPSAKGSSSTKLPPITIRNTSIPKALTEQGNVTLNELFPNSKTLEGKENALYDLYDLNGEFNPLDMSSWLNSASTYGTIFGAALNRKETDIRDRFMKVRIRYSGEDLAVIDWLNTIYTISYA